METLRLENIDKKFGDNIALNNINFSIDEGKLFTFLGPSGCGKTTILRIIAGFLEPDNGKVYIGNKDITNLPPESREVGMVFQNYALFPHLNVYENIAYGLKVKKLPKKTIDEKVNYYLKLVNLSEYSNRKIYELSGGEQQRVALARSLAIEPKILLLDEPLSNLDAKLRDKMRMEIRELQQKLGITTIFVTHDQGEALTISDKIAVFDKGICVQIGTPREVYNNPTNSFVASFIGETNLFKVNDILPFNIPSNKKGEFISIRPQEIELTREFDGDKNSFRARIESIQFNGISMDYICNIDGTKLKVTMLNTENSGNGLSINDEICLKINPDSIKVID
ncbi:ABC transporter ATP-binding protein [Sporanaerobacter acetigenes]|uniref:Iron(III) transport system ATP-binding protein n=1 Tax=Sporanaerobacter acetigenes DSM 13106 TaxID=1123281 RepID=A0A1M5YBT7_9FIRM|nr:ABC transporter ATP-binding protein [Sporanaerobacter acetigenes]SHI08963.1 iron(III) transport system ATP-binding protein [Sporanaerobacter acetigenes DSM 13106]